LIRDASLALMLPARSERVAPLIASRAWVGSLMGNDLPGPAKSLDGIAERRFAVSLAIANNLAIDPAQLENCIASHFPEYRSYRCWRWVLRWIRLAMGGNHRKRISNRNGMVIAMHSIATTVCGLNTISTICGSGAIISYP
jgi:hypothetical protein